MAFLCGDFFFVVVLAISDLNRWAYQKNRKRGLNMCEFAHQRNGRDEIYGKRQNKINLKGHTIP